MGWVRDRRDSALLPTKGTLTRVGGELAGRRPEVLPPATFSISGCTPISRTVTLSLRGDFGYAGGYSGEPVPFFKNFYAGGPDSVRGYEAFSLGPQDQFGNVLGGTRKITGSAEVLFPVPGAANGQVPAARLRSSMRARCSAPTRRSPSAACAIPRASASPGPRRSVRCAFPFAAAPEREEGL